MGREGEEGEAGKRAWENWLTIWKQKMIQPVGKPPEVSRALYLLCLEGYSANEWIGARLNPNIHCDHLEGGFCGRMEGRARGGRCVEPLRGRE